MAKFRKLSTRSQALASMKNISLSLKEKPRMATFLFWGKNKTKSSRNWASANSKKSTEIFTQRSSETKTTKRKKSTTSSSRTISAKSPLSKTYKTWTISAITVLPPKLSRKSNKSQKNNTPSRYFSSMITQRSRLKRKCWLWVKKREKKLVRSVIRWRFRQNQEIWNGLKTIENRRF